MSNEIYLTDGGLETSLIFLEGFDLPYFAAFDLLKEEVGYRSIQNYYREYLKIAADFNTGFILESPTWRASPDWIEKIGYPASSLDSINKKSVELLSELKHEFGEVVNPIILSGCVGPRGDGYSISQAMSPDEAQAYHFAQISVFRNTPVEVVSAITMNYVEEAMGITRAANKADLPVVISFTVETDGKLPSGMSLSEAINLLDNNVAIPPKYYLINCAHPSHFARELVNDQGEYWMSRIKGIRANASCKSHAELDESTELDRGNPKELGHNYALLKQKLTHLNVFGGCCGTDAEHIFEIISHLTQSNFDQ